MIAFKWLAAGALSPFTRVAWTPQQWVSASGPDGIHACRVADLPFWISDELWRAELEQVIEHPRQLQARRARLLQRVEAWDARAFARACAGRAEAEALPGAKADLQAHRDAARHCAEAGLAAPAAFISARAAAAARGAAAFEEERAWQARWLAQTLQLF